MTSILAFARKAALFGAVALSATACTQNNFYTDRATEQTTGTNAYASTNALSGPSQSAATYAGASGSGSAISTAEFAGSTRTNADQGCAAIATPEKAEANCDE